MFDIFYIAREKDDQFKKLKEKFITAKHALGVFEAQQKSTTKFFYTVYENCIISGDFNFDYIPDDFSQNVPHLFLNGDYYDNIALIPKKYALTKKETEYRFYVNKKHVEIVVSKPKKYDIFKIETYDDYLYALENSTTELFWATTPNIDTSAFDFNLYFEHSDVYNRKENHAFIHRIDDKDLYNGVFLLSKYKKVTEKEIEFRHLVSRKEWDIVASTAIKYSIYSIETYDDYLYALENSTTELFWATTPNIDTSEFDINLYFTHDDHYNRKENHAFIHKVDDKNLYNGLFLLSKYKKVTEKEIEFRHLVSRKEHNTAASKPINYCQFKIDTYAEYEYALKNSKTELFYAIPSQVECISIPDLYFSHDDVYHRKENHVFKNICNDEEKFNGIYLLTKHKTISKKELEHRHIVYKKTWNIIASKHKPYDVVFISYNELNADENYKNLLKKAPYAKRVHGIKGIHQAHIQAAKISNSEMVWIVDADAVLVDDFNLDLYLEKWDRETVHVWRSINPINDLIYGYGGVKLFPRILTINMDINNPDMTTSITSKFKAMPTISNITAFNTDPFSTWKSAFRECCKLASKVIDRQKSKETEDRLQIWCTIGKDKLFGEHAVTGAKAGKEYGENNRGDLEALRKINDFDWLKEQFEKY